MEKITIHKNKEEAFRCNLNIQGADDTQVRLCLEFEDNKNLFFHGILKENGECVVTIPKLKEFQDKNGKLYLEAVADSTYFKLYEADFELKNSVDIKIENIQFTNEKAVVNNQKRSTPAPNLKVELSEPIVNPFLPKKYK